MAKTKVVEKEETALAGELLKVTGLGKKAWPFCCFVSFVRRKRPVAVTSAMPSRASTADLNPLKVKFRSLVEDGVEIWSRSKGIRSLENMARPYRVFSSAMNTLFCNVDLLWFLK